SSSKAVITIWRFCPRPRWCAVGAAAPWPYRSNTSARRRPCCNGFAVLIRGLEASQRLPVGMPRWRSGLARSDEAPLELEAGLGGAAQGLDQRVEQADGVESRRAGARDAAGGHDRRAAHDGHQAA